MDRRPEGENGALAGRVDLIRKERRAERRKKPARMAKGSAQAGNEFGMVDCGPRGGKGIRRGFTGKVLGSCSGICRKTIFREKGSVAADLRRAIETEQINRKRREGLPVPDDGAVVSQPRICADQADDEYACRFWFGVDALQREIAKEFGRYGRAGKKRPHYAP